MSDLADRNATATRQGLEDHEQRIVDLENQLLTIRGQLQTMHNLFIQLQQSNNLALQKLVGTGATAHGDDD